MEFRLKICCRGLHDLRQRHASAVRHQPRSSDRLAPHLIRLAGPRAQRSARSAQPGTMVHHRAKLARDLAFHVIRAVHFVGNVTNRYQGACTGQELTRDHAAGLRPLSYYLALVNANLFIAVGSLTLHHRDHTRQRHTDRDHRAPPRTTRSHNGHASVRPPSAVHTITTPGDEMPGYSGCSSFPFPSVREEFSLPVALLPRSPGDVMRPAQRGQQPGSRRGIVFSPTLETSPPLRPGPHTAPEFPPARSRE